MSLIVGEPEPTFASVYFYRGEVEVKIDSTNHRYYLVTPDRKLVLLPGSSSVVKLIDKSEALMNWACSQMEAAVIAEVPVIELEDGQRMVRQMPVAMLETILAMAKRAHKTTFLAAADLGHAAHALDEATKP
jgi:hypothetical protein